MFYNYDHLGNTRVTYNVRCSPNNSFTYNISTALDYYPYGKELRAYNSVGEKYKSTTNERDLETGYDFRNARSSSADAVRFNTVDPLAGRFANVSPYCYVGGNPVRLIDPSGKEIDVSYETDENGHTNVKIHYTAMLVNNSAYSYNADEVSQIKALFESALKDIWGGGDAGSRAVGNYSISVSGSLSVFTSIDGSLGFETDYSASAGFDPKMSIIAMSGGFSDYAWSYPDGSRMELNASGFLSNAEEAKQTVAHEWGHMLGIKFHSDVYFKEAGRQFTKEAFDELNLPADYKPDNRNPTYDATSGDALNLMRKNSNANDTNLVPEQVRTILDAPNTDYRTNNPQNH